MQMARSLGKKGLEQHQMDLARLYTTNSGHRKCDHSDDNANAKSKFYEIKAILLERQTYML